MMSGEIQNFYRSTGEVQDAQISTYRDNGDVDAAQQVQAIVRKLARAEVPISPQPIRGIQLSLPVSDISHSSSFPGFERQIRPARVVRVCTVIDGRVALPRRQRHRI